MTPDSRAAWALPPIVHALRDATRDTHDRLDSNNPISQAAGIDLPAYDEILRRYLVAHRAVEAALEPWAPFLATMGVALDERRKVPMLERDLAFTASLLAGRHEAEIDQTAFDLSSPGSAWGALYVVEGSTLGGQHIFRTLQGSSFVERHALSPDAGLSYFAGYGDRTGDMWRRFLGALGEADGADLAERDSIIEGASHTFALFERVLAHCDQSPRAA
jgi:Heme oxygenase